LTMLIYYRIERTLKSKQTNLWKNNR